MHFLARVVADFPCPPPLTILSRKEEMPISCCWSSSSPIFLSPCARSEFLGMVHALKIAFELFLHTPLGYVLSATMLHAGRPQTGAAAKRPRVQPNRYGKLADFPCQASIR